MITIEDILFSCFVFAISYASGLAIAWLFSMVAG